MANRKKELEDSQLKQFSTLAAVFTLGYKISQSSAEELKEAIDSILDFLENYGEKAVSLIKKVLDITEDMPSDEVKANIEKIVSNAVDKIDKI